ncbi:putative TOM core complex subunit Tom6 [Polychaeton citri CBS 116435]|uniref:TOM core complex subunit Tom6 n=1 Tax=Polychaeton citri CBS 116435 TaxID=1314669 RepID=A0A9P4Q9L3_9PEZI|nr:putative TOM core complex subunit Tom6 [Polychaeton citri CBS 116435]
MPPKGRGIALGGSQPARSGYARNVINELTSPENRSVVTAITFFAGAVVFLHSSWSEVLIPPL